MWIHYSIEKGVLFSFSGLPTKKRHYTVFHRKDPAFISRGHRNWKKTGQRFLENETSDCHKGYRKLLDTADDGVDVRQQISDSLVNEKA